MNHARASLVGCVLAALTGVADARGALITFTGLFNGVTTTSDPENAGFVAIPSNYQPLLQSYPKSSTDPTPGDGANIGVTITWTTGNASSTNGTTTTTTTPTAPDDAYNGNGSPIVDHTGDYNATAKTGGGLMFQFNKNSYAMNFDQPVTIPSLYFTFFAGGARTGSIDAYANVGDALPVAHVDLNSNDAAGYIWHNVTALGTTPISRIVFAGTNEALNIDDVTVNAVPEPALPSLLCCAAAALGARRRAARSRA